MNVSFISHDPHNVHLEYAKCVGAKFKQSGMRWFVNLYKKFAFIRIFMPFISFIYSYKIKTDSDILLLDGGSSLFIGYYLKKRNPKLKLIYLDGDLIFYKTVHGNNSFFQYMKDKLLFKITKCINGVISVSNQNKTMISQYVNCNIKVCVPYVRDMKKLKIKRQNYALYVGRLDPDKNISRIISFCLGCEDIKKLIVIGNGSEKCKIEKLSKLNNKILYLGEITNVNKYYYMCKYLIHLPDYDPHPVVVMEALKCGCIPILSKGVGSNYFVPKEYILSNLSQKCFDNIIKKTLLNDTNTNIKDIYLPNKNTQTKLFKKYFLELL
ncbi:MAG: glycosyltransferase [Candidatus Woesearchaeota archaeon]